MNNANKRRQFMLTLNLILTAMILLGVIVIAGWMLMLDRQVSQISSAAGDLAIQLTLQSTLDTYREEIEAEETTAVALETEDTAAGELKKTDTPEAEPTKEPTSTPKPAESELDESGYEDISLILSPSLHELSEERYFRLPPLRFEFPEDWKFRFDSAGTLTIKDALDNETTMEVWADNPQTEFLLNEIGYFEALADGELGWYPDTTPREGLGAGEYRITFEIGEYISEPIRIFIEDSPMARILESIPMYRNYEDIEEDRRYLSFSSQQEPMSMYGYMISPEGTIYIRVWRSHDKYYYWVNGEFVMHPDRGLLYNSVEDLRDDTGQEIIPEITFAGY